MARPLRVNRPDVWYNVTARGTERRDIFRDERDRRHLLELMAAGTERFGLRVHAYVLMPNHYHLLLAAPRANLSPALQWINVSYSVWFNRRHERVGRVQHRVPVRGVRLDDHAFDPGQVFQRLDAAQAEVVAPADVRNDGSATLIEPEAFAQNAALMRRARFPTAPARHAAGRETAAAARRR